MSSTSQNPTLHNPTPAEKRVRNFVNYLRRLEDHDDGKARAALATLRQGLREKDGIAIAMMPHVVPHLGETDEPWFFAVGALFALHPQSGGSGSLGTAYGRLRSESDSIEKRFQMLLACEEEDLFRLLNQTISLLKAHNMPVNWYSLLSDLAITGWEHPQRKVQLKWARNFYGTTTSSASDSDDAASASDPSDSETSI